MRGRRAAPVCCDCRVIAHGPADGRRIVHATNTRTDGIGERMMRRASRLERQRPLNDKSVTKPRCYQCLSCHKWQEVQGNSVQRGFFVFDSSVLSRTQERTDGAGTPTNAWTWRVSLIHMLGWVNLTFLRLHSCYHRHHHHRSLCQQVRIRHQSCRRRRSLLECMITTAQ